MKRFFTALFLLFLIIGVCTAGLMVTRKQKNEYSDLLYSAYRDAMISDFDTAFQKVRKFCKDFKRNEPFLAMLLHRKDLDEIAFTAKMMKEYANCRQLPEFCAELKKELALLDHLWETEVPVPTNVF